MVKNPRNKVTIVQGGQYGSEAKGAITGYICETENVDICVRTGAVNAGHTVFYKGHPYKMQQLPVGWVNPDVMLVIGAGALVHTAILESECEMVSRATGKDIRERLFIDYNAGVHTSSHTDRSTASGRHHAIGATGKGSSEALIDKIRLRGSGYQTFGRLPGIDNTYSVGNTAGYLNKSWDAGKKIVLEGTQGTLLDLHTGPYPYVTHKSCLPASWMAECGLSPALPTDVVLVVRTYPIRVAGNSGFMPGEISWPILAREINDKRREAGMPPIVEELAIRVFENAVREVARAARYPMPEMTDGLDQHKWDDRFKYQAALSELHADAIRELDPGTVTELSKLFELTTVTKKLRRVARLSLPDLHAARDLCRPHRIAMTFMNYEFPETWFTDPDMTAALGQAEVEYLNLIEKVTEAPVQLVSYGPGSEHILRRWKGI